MAALPVPESEFAFSIADVPCEASRQVSTTLNLAHELRVGGDTYPVTYHILPYTSEPADLPFILSVYGEHRFELTPLSHGIQALYFRHPTDRTYVDCEGGVHHYDPEWNEHWQDVNHPDAGFLDNWMSGLLGDPNEEEGNAKTPLKIPPLKYSGMPPKPLCAHERKTAQTRSVYGVLTPTVRVS